jgi:hypothetical protein
MAFNGPMYRQERLSKDEIKLLKEAVRTLHETNDQVKFLYQKLERMEKGRK